MQYEKLKAELKSQLIAIYHLGDEDECSWKHLGHAYAALIVRGDYLEAEDYFDPFGGEGSGKDIDELENYWQTISFLVDGEDFDTLQKIAEELSNEDGRLMMLDRYITDYQEGI